MSREKQRRRTRRAILDAAAELLRAGQQPTVTEVADAADVSRATAYSYFPSQHVLLDEAALELAEGAKAEGALEQAWAECGDDIGRRWEAFCPIYQELFCRNEAVYRAMLRAQQDRWLEANRTGEADSVVVRQARRLPLIDKLLEPVRSHIADSAYRQLAEGLAMVVGIEPLVVLKDVCGVRFEEAAERMLWAGQVMIEATLADAATRLPGSPD